MHDISRFLYVFLIIDRIKKSFQLFKGFFNWFKLRLNPINEKTEVFKLV